MAVARAKWRSDGSTDVIRPVRRERHARLLCAGGPQSLVRARLCLCLRARLGLRVPARRLAVRAGGGDLGGCRAAAVGDEATAGGIARLRRKRPVCYTAGSMRGLI